MRWASLSVERSCQERIQVSIKCRAWVLGVIMISEMNSEGGGSAQEFEEEESDPILELAIEYARSLLKPGTERWRNVPSRSAYLNTE